MSEFVVWNSISSQIYSLDILSQSEKSSWSVREISENHKCMNKNKKRQPRESNSGRPGENQES